MIDLVVATLCLGALSPIRISDEYLYDMAPKVCHAGNSSWNKFSALEQLDKVSDTELAFNKIFFKLSSFLNLEDDWDGYGSVKPNEETIALSKSLLDEIKNNKLTVPKLMLTGSGEITFLWNFGDYHIELAVDELAETVFYFIAKNKALISSEDIPVSHMNNIRMIPNEITRLIVAYENNHIVQPLFYANSNTMPKAAVVSKVTATISSEWSIMQNTNVDLLAGMSTRCSRTSSTPCVI